ncbi:hypothetical protein BpHYR1_024628 [Brachionus plicatilis]|uniref:Uncharacterized protein n=1 Tax=Brachionus plicatilis TaxID=10195 RepID=A0A3M7SR19_BRAPC|nr:hypothetical protein BpHYR1_024628 [Brachionus plicatilis]
MKKLIIMIVTNFKQEKAFKTKFIAKRILNIFLKIISLRRNRHQTTDGYFSLKAKQDLIVLWFH